MSDKLVMRLMVLSNDVVIDQDLETADAERVREVVQSADHVCVYVHPESNFDPSENGVSIPFLKQQAGKRGLGSPKGSLHRRWQDSIVKASKDGLDAFLEAVDLESAHRLTSDNFKKVMEALEKGKKVRCLYCGELVTETPWSTGGTAVHTCDVDCMLIEGEAPIDDEEWRKKFYDRWFGTGTVIPLTGPMDV